MEHFSFQSELKVDGSIAVLIRIGVPKKYHKGQWMECENPQNFFRWKPNMVYWLNLKTILLERLDSFNSQIMSVFLMVSNDEGMRVLLKVHNIEVFFALSS